MTLFSSSASPTGYDLDEHSALIALSMVPNVGAGRLRKLIHRFGSARTVLELSPNSLTRVNGIGKKTARAIARFDEFDAVQQQIERAARLDAKLVSVSDERFPPRLREIFDPPPFLWMRGELTADDEPSLAVVGTRKASKYGKRMARKLAGDLAKRNITVVSGLAYGIDTAAHTGALEAGGRTIAVLGSGVDWIYPSSNRGLARQITRRGALLSEYPLGTKPDAGNFPQRNRIISGMTAGTVVVESARKGGALITAYLALEQNREVFAVPGRLPDRTSAGTHRLIKRGHAKLITGIDDVLEELEHVLPGSVTSDPSPGRIPEAGGDGGDEVDVTQLNRVERRLYEALTDRPVHIDALCRKTNLDPSTALVYLLNLEFEGLVRQMAGKQFYRVSP